MNGERVALTEDERYDLETPLNSVPYFALLPYFLQDPAVRTRYLGEATLLGEPYHKVEVTFSQHGGGRDYQDRYVYWFHRNAHTMDYLAYDFHTDDGGTRFRRAVNARTVGGVRFADYLNFTSDSLDAPGTPIERFDVLFEAGHVDSVSTVALENVQVRPLRP